MAWIRESKKPWFQTLCANVLKMGPVPKHIAFIMDGNRRFAQKRNFECAKGHLMGFDKLAETLEWCLDIGVTEVTVYAFSIENFKRSKEEVDCLMELSREKFARLMQEKEMLEKHGVCIRVLGNLTLLPVDIQEMIAEAVLLTQGNTRATLNVAFSYTSRDEICCAMREVVEGVELGLIRESDINESLLERCFYSNQSPDPDLLVRTSGEVRLSDFLLWQSSFSMLSFMRVLWPEFSVWHLYAGVLTYQRNFHILKKTRDKYLSEVADSQRLSDFESVMEELQERKRDNGLVREHNTTTTSGSNNMEQRVQQYSEQRRQREESFLQHVQDKRDNYLQGLYNRPHRTVHSSGH